MQDISPQLVLIAQAAVKPMQIGANPPAEYNQDAAKKENDGKLPSERDAYKQQIGVFGALQKRQVQDKNGKLLAEFTIGSALGAPSDMAIAINDTALQITSENGNFKVGGREGIKIIDVKTGKPRDKLFDDAELVDKIVVVHYNTPKGGSQIVIGNDPVGTQTRFSTGDAKVYVNVSGVKKAERVKFADPKAKYAITVNELSLKNKNGINAGHMLELPSITRFTRMEDSAKTLDIAVVPGNSTLQFKYDNRKPVEIELFKDGKPGAAFGENPGDISKEHALEKLIGNLNGMLSQALEAKFESNKLPPKVNDAKLLKLTPNR